MPLQINGKEPTVIFVGSREVKRAVLNGKTVYEKLREVTLVKAGLNLWETIPTNSLCYPIQQGGKLAVAFRYPMQCTETVKYWNMFSYASFSSGNVIPADTATLPSTPAGNYVFTRV